MKQVNSSTNLTMAESMLQTGHVVKDKWQVVNKIGQGAFGEVYKCKDLISSRQVALKLVSKERVTSASHLLKLEVTVLKELQGKHYFPRFVGFGKTERFDYLVMELLGPSLSELKRHQPDRKFSLSTTLRLGYMMLKCIHSIHKAGYLHRDIKPSNFTIGIGEENRRRVYLLDFGLARQYVLENGEVRPPRYKVSFHGTPRYASLRVLQGKEAGRQDDLMSLFYTLSEFSFRDLPWKNIRDYREMAQAKESFDHQILVKEFPDEFQDFYNHISELTFFDKPDYELLYSVFDRCIKRRGVKDTDPFDFEEDGNQPVTNHIRINNTSSVHSKSSSDVIIIDCVSHEETDKLHSKNHIKRSRSTSNNMHHLIATFGLEDVKKDQLLRSKSSNNMIKKNMNNFYNNSKDTGFSFSPFSTNSHCQPSISISMEPDLPVKTSTRYSTCGGSKTKLKSQSSVESNKLCFSQQTESLFMDSLSKDNFSLETSRAENSLQRPSLSMNKILKKELNLSRLPCINSLSVFRSFKDKGKKQKVRHSVRRSVSHPASIPSHLLIKSIFHDSNRNQGQQGLPRCWSCPTISLFIRSDLKPPLKQQASFDENVYEVDVMRNVAAKQLADDPVHVDCRRNSLPFILSSKSLAKEQVSCEEKIEKTQTNTSDVKMLNTSRIQETKEQNSIVPSTTQRFLQKGIENYDCNASQDAMMKVQKSLSDSNVYQRSVNNNVRVRREARIKDEALFNKIAHEQNPLMKSTKINSFIENYEIDYYDTDKDISELKITSASSINQLNCDLKRRYLHVCNEQNSSRYSDIYKNDRLIEEGVSTLEKNEDIYNFQAHNYVNEKEKPKIIVDPERCMKKTIDFLGNPNEHHILMNKTNTFDNCNSTDKINIQTNENHKEINALHEPKKDIPARKVESHDMQQYSIPEIPNLKIHSETDTLNAKDISSKKSEIFKNPEIQLHNMPAVS
ncbi:tau-tubulin kinase homolog Asator, partial [Caerostris darwini]